MKAKIENRARAGEKSKLTRGNIGSAKSREVWTKPVSKGFYEKLRVKVSNIVTSLGYVRGYTDEIMKSIDRYMINGEVPTRHYCEEYFMAIFFTLRVEVDEAMARSAAARQRAAQRRARKAEERKEAESKKKLVVSLLESRIREIGSTDSCPKPIYPECGDEPERVTVAAIGEASSVKLRNASPVNASSVETMFKSASLMR